MVKTCELCNEGFEAKRSNARYCGKDHLKACLTCGEDFVLNPSKMKDFCSHRCSINHGKSERECKRCGEAFLAKGKQVYCEGPHYFHCEGCGGKFEEKIAKRVTRFCSGSCASKNRKFERICELCDESFMSGKSNARFCTKDHYTDCVVCETAFLIVNPFKLALTCDPKCAWKVANEDNKLVEKRKQIFLERYGVDNPAMTEEVKEKKKATLRERYGVENASHSPEFVEKRRQTNLQRYGVENGGGAPEVQARIKQTNLERYGVENVFQAEEVKTKIRETLLERYGVTNPYQLPQAIEGLKESGSRRISKMNLALKETIESWLGKEIMVEAPFGEGHYADLGINDVLIDLNPTVTHSSTLNFVHITGRCNEGLNCTNETHLAIPSTWHQKRMLAAEAEGKLLLQKFDWYDDEIFLSIIKSKLGLDSHRVGARKCELREISQTEANNFLKENHLLGPAKQQTFCVGLFYEDELVHVHTYGPARMNSNYQWEAIRSASKMDWQVMGGFSRCDKHFFATQKPKSVISYVDLAISHGSTELMFPGWKALKNRPNAPAGTWVYVGPERDRNGKPKFVKAKSAAFQSADRLLGLPINEKYPSHHPDGRVFTNSEVLIAEGYLQVFDAGSKTFLWETPRT